MFIAGAGAVGRVGRPGLSGNGARRPSFDVDFVGSGSLGAGGVFTRASTGTYYDSAGVLRTAGLNIALQSGDFSNAAWQKFGATSAAPVVTGNAVSAPDGTLTASSIVYPVVTTSPARSLVFQNITVAAVQHTFSVWMKGAAGGEQIYMDAQNGLGLYYSSPRFVLSTAWQRFSFTTPALTAISWTFTVGTDLRDAGQTSTPAQTIYAWGGQVETGTFASPYAPTTTVANSGPRFDYDPQTLQLKGLLLEDASTNLALNSGDFSNASWGKTFGGAATTPVVTGNNVTAPDGTLTAARIVYPAVSGAGSYSNVAATIAPTAAPYTFSVYLRGNAGGETLYIYTTPNGVLYYKTPVTLTTAWQRFVLVTPALSTANWFWTVGTDLRDATQVSTPAQTIFAWGAQVEALPYMSSHIPTTSVSVTRARDALSYPVANVTGFDTTKGSLAHEYYVEGCVPNFNAPIQFVGAITNTDFISVDQTTNAFGATGSTPVANVALVKVAGVNQGNAILGGGTGIPIPGGVVHRCAAAWALTGNTICAHDGVGQTSTTGTNTSLPVVVNLTIAGLANAQPNVFSQWARRTRYWPRQLSQAELVSVTTLDGPTLSLDFMSDGTLDPRITFTRASSATYTDASGVVQTAATNAPRWDYANGVLRGLLIEEARTNIAFPSTNWHANATAGSGDGVVQNVGISPSGASDAMALIAGTTNTVHQFFVGFAGAISTTYTYSVYLKAAGRTQVLLTLGNSGFPGDQNVNLDLSNGTIVAQCANGSGTIRAVGNGWYRCSVTNTSDADGGNYIPVICVIGPGGADPFPGNAIDGVWAWGKQIEAGNFSTSVIPTTSVSVTRAADVANITPLGTWFDANAGSFSFAYDMTRAGGVIGGFSSGAFANVIYVSQTASGVATNIASVGVSANGSPISATGITQKTVVSYSAARLAICNNGLTVGTNSALAAGPYPWTLNMCLGSAPWSVGSSAICGHLQRVNYWNRALSDTEMQQVTT